MQNNYKYNIIILKNKSQTKKVLFWSQKEETSMRRWKTYSRRKEAVIIPKLNASYQHVEYDIVFAKQVDGEPKPYDYKDSMGKNIQISLDGNWEIMYMEPHKIEETFKVYGRRRMTVKEIVGYVIMSLETLTSIGLINNKVIMHNEYKSELILCKNKHDGERLYNAIVDITRGRSKNLLYAGRYKGNLMTYALSKIQETLGVSNRILYRKTTAD
jgi:hypothetical protein